MERLRQILTRIDGRGYKAYKDIQGEYRFPFFTLYIDYVQGDPFASPSRIRVRMDQQRARYDRQWYADEHRRIALEDWVLRQAAREVQSLSFRVQGTGKSGLLRWTAPARKFCRGRRWW